MDKVNAPEYRATISTTDTTPDVAGVGILA